MQLLRWLRAGLLHNFLRRKMQLPLPTWPPHMPVALRWPWNLVSLTALTAYNTAKTEHATAKTAHDEDASLDNANALKTAADTLLAAAMDADEKGALGATADQQTELASVSVTNAEAYVATAEDDLTTAQTAADAAAVVAATAADAAAVVAATAEAVTKTTAIKAEADDPAADAAGLPATVTMMDISRDRTATTIEIDAGPGQGKTIRSSRCTRTWAKAAPCTLARWKRIPREMEMWLKK